MKKRFWMFSFLLALALEFNACVNTKDSPATSGDSGMQSEAQTTTKEGKTYHVGIVQLTQHPALDSATRGFQEELKEQFGDAVTFDVKNASGEVANVTTIINGFVASNSDLILANATAPVHPIWRRWMNRRKCCTNGSRMQKRWASSIRHPKLIASSRCRR